MLFYNFLTNIKLLLFFIDIFYVNTGLEEILQVLSFWLETWTGKKIYSGLTLLQKPTVFSEVWI